MKPPKIISIHGKTQNNSFWNNQISSETKVAFVFLLNSK